MPELPHATLRRAASEMRADAQKLLDEIDAKWDTSLPHGQAYSRVVDDGLGGPAGKYAAAWHPGVALAVADWLDAVAAGPEELRDMLGVWSFPESDPGWQAALKTARAYLNEQP